MGAVSLPPPTPPLLTARLPPLSLLPAQVFSPDARSLGCITGLNMPSDVAVDPLDNIIVADTGSHAIKVFGPTGGEPLVVYGGRKTMGEPGYFCSPMGVDIAVRFRMKDALKRWGEAPQGTKIKTDDDRVIVVADTGAPAPRAGRPALAAPSHGRRGRQPRHPSADSVAARSGGGGGSIRGRGGSAGLRKVEGATLPAGGAGQAPQTQHGARAEEEGGGEEE